MSENKEQKRVAIVDFGMGNVWSVASAVKYLGCIPDLVKQADQLAQYRHIILPGVGSFYEAMQALTSQGFDSVIKQLVLEDKVNLLGICLGMQLIGESSTEDKWCEGLGLITNKVTEFSKEEVGQRKVPHVGFNLVSSDSDAALFSELPPQADFYFTHSYKMLMEPGQSGIAVCNYGTDFVAAFDFGNICGAQFHPEKSQTNGLILLNNFLKKQ